MLDSLGFTVSRLNTVLCHLVVSLLTKLFIISCLVDRLIITVKTSFMHPQRFLIFNASVRFNKNPVYMTCVTTHFEKLLTLQKFIDHIKAL